MFWYPFRNTIRITAISQKIKYLTSKLYELKVLGYKTDERVSTCVENFRRLEDELIDNGLIKNAYHTAYSYRKKDPNFDFNDIIKTIKLLTEYLDIELVETPKKIEFVKKNKE